VQKQAADSISQKPAEAAPTVVPSSGADQPLNAESRNENLVAAAAAAWPIIPNTEGTGAGGAAADTTEAANANAVQLVDPNEVNELDRAAETAQAESSWSTYLLLLLGAALAAASAMWFFLRVASIFARRAANLRMHMSNPKRATALSLEAPHFPRFCSLNSALQCQALRDPGPLFSPR
jgi:hypothetical protein